MPKYKVLKQKYTTADNIPQSFIDNIWVGKINDDDTLDIFDFYAEAKYFADQLKQQNSERNYKVVEITGDVKLTDVKTVYDDKGNEYKINSL